MTEEPLLSEELREIEAVCRRVIGSTETVDGEVFVAVETFENLARLMNNYAQNAEALERVVRAALLRLADIETPDGKVVRLANYRHRKPNRGDAA